MRTSGLLQASGDLEGRVRYALLSRSFLGAHSFEIIVENDTVTIRGTVHTYYERQVLVHSCLKVPGVRTVIDEICVAA